MTNNKLTYKQAIEQIRKYKSAIGPTV